jgi:FHS family L-fucose permease-like MFS transporter
MTTTTASPGQADHSNHEAAYTTDLRWYVFALFFLFGGITSLNDVLIPKLKHLFELSYFQVMTIQFAFFAAYFVVSMPGAALVKRFGHMRTATIGLLTMTLGCLLFIPASYSGRFPAFLGALFTLAAGITIVQVVANPLISMLGPTASTHSRLTFAQAFNSLGTTVFPFVGAILILGSLASVDESTLTSAGLRAFRAQETRVIASAYLGLALVLAAVAVLVWLGRHRLREPPPHATSLAQAFDLLRRPRFAFGVLGIFVYVGGEVAIGSMLANYLMAADTLAVAARQAGELVAFYWGGAMVGRFVGAWALVRFRPGRVLVVAALGACSLLAVSATTLGVTSGVALIAVGFCNSIMFPTIFALACEGLGRRAADGSGIICMAIVGGAIVPLIAGYTADVASLRAALAVPFACYVVIAAFAFHCLRHPPHAGAAAAAAPAIH